MGLLKSGDRQYLSTYLPPPGNPGLSDRPLCHGARGGEAAGHQQENTVHQQGLQVILHDSVWRAYRGRTQVGEGSWT